MADKETEELESWDAKLEVEDTAVSGVSGSKVEKECKTENERGNSPVDSPDIAVSRSARPKKPSKKEKKNRHSKKKEAEAANGTVEKMEMGDTADMGDQEKEAEGQGGDEEDEEVERELQQTAADADGPSRNALFEKALQLERKKKKDLALKCYLRCLHGLKDNTGFTYVPQCLHNIANIYYEKEEFAKAIQFIQAEKMYYETALIDTSELQKKLEERQKDVQEETDDPLATQPEALRATEYEHLAKLCLDKNQPQLALEYCGKATKLRQQVYGENHPISLKTLDFFTIVYAEAGKQQYSESMKKLTADDLLNITDLRLSGAEGDLSGLRKRKKSDPNNTAKSEERRVHFQEDISPQKQTEEQMSRTLLWIFFLISITILAVLGLYLYCRLNARSTSCHNFGSILSYYVMRVKYYYYHYTASSKNMYG